MRFNFNSQATVIGLYSSVPQQGKSTAAQILVEKHGYRKLSFAFTLKRMVHSFLTYHGYRDEDAEQFLNGSKKDMVLERVSGMPTTRHLLVTLGTEWGRNMIHQDIWLDNWISIAGAWARSGQPVVADDMRFPNEYQAIKELGGRVVRIERGEISEEEAYGRFNMTEGRLNGVKFDRLIRNTSDLSYLQNEIESAVKFFHRKGNK